MTPVLQTALDGFHSTYPRHRAAILAKEKEVSEQIHATFDPDKLYYEIGLNWQVYSAQPQLFIEKLAVMQADIAKSQQTVAEASKLVVDLQMTAKRIKMGIEVLDNPRDLKYVRHLQEKLRDLETIAGLLEDQLDLLQELQGELKGVQARFEPSEKNVYGKMIISDYCQSAQLPPEKYNTDWLSFVARFVRKQDPGVIRVSRVMLEGYFASISFKSPTVAREGHQPMYLPPTLPFLKLDTGGSRFSVKPL